jgi:hypothetical protein
MERFGITPPRILKKVGAGGTLRGPPAQMFNFEEVKNALAFNIGVDLPDKIQEEAGRGTKIALRADQFRVLDYWAQAHQKAMVGVSLYLDNHSVEYWMPMTIDPIADEPLDRYLVELQRQ